MPVPPLQIPPVAMVTAPFSCTATLFAHTVWSGPAFAVGAAPKLIVIWSVEGEHAPLPVVMSVKVTLPDAISAGVGVYTAFMVVLFGL